MCDLRHFVSSAIVGVAQSWSTACVMVTFNAKAPQEVGDSPLSCSLCGAAPGKLSLRGVLLWLFSSWRIVFKLRNTSGKQHFLSFLGVTHEWQATVITRQGICQAMCSCSCHSVERWAEGSTRSKLIILMIYVTFCKSTVFVLLLLVAARFCVPWIGEKKQRLQSPVGQRVARSRGFIWKLQGKCPKIINLGTPQAAVNQQWIHIIEFQANHSSLRVKLWINIRQNTPSGKPCLM